MGVYNIVSMLILLIGITVSILTLELILRYRSKWYLFLPVFVWALHLTIFYSLVIYTGLMGISLDILFNFPGLFSWWSVLQRLNGVITMLFMTILLSVEIKYDFFKNEIVKEAKALLQKKRAKKLQ